MMKIFANITYLFPVMGYYLIESIIVGGVVMLMWKLFLSNLWGNIGYVQIVVVYWIIKMLLFDIFKLIGSFQPNPQNDNTNNEN